jgi:hypothetical protein
MKKRIREILDDYSFNIHLEDGGGTWAIEEDQFNEISEDISKETSDFDRKEVKRLLTKALSDSGDYKHPLYKVISRVIIDKLT